MNRNPDNENLGMYTMYHPDIRAGTEEGLTQKFWAHHEKIVVIDQKTAFVGGIDLCVGRYEIHGEYPLFDKDDTFRGNDFFNHYVASNWMAPDRSKWRSPWHDIACQVNYSIDQYNFFLIKRLWPFYL